ncbi:MAG TPA: hypothetical protein VF777_05410 [Phycisphaerales bacterium]
MSDAPSDPGTMLKLGFVVVCVGGCALGVLALRQAGLQAGHELAQTQLRIQKADEDLWKLRAEISTLAAPARIRELADKLGPLHGLTPRPEDAASSGEISAATGPAIATVPEAPKPTPSKPAAKPSPKTAAPKTTAPKTTTPKTAEKPAEKPTEKPASPSSRPGLKPSSERSAPPTGKPEAKPDGKPETKPGVQPDSKPSTKPSTKPTSAPKRTPSTPGPTVT